MTTTTEWQAESETSPWALCWQAAVGRDFLATPLLAAKIRNRLISALHQRRRELIDFVLLPMEIHAIASIGSDDSVGSVARGIGNVVSRWVRQTQPVRGPVLAGRFWAHPIESEEALRIEVRMLAWRPVVRRVSVTPTYHPHGALRAALGLATSKGFDARPLLLHFGGSVPSARKALRQWVSRRPSEREWRTWELTRGLEPATSAASERRQTTRAFNRASAALIAAAGGSGVDGALDMLEAWVTLRLQAPSMRSARVRRTGLGPRARGLVACLAVDHGLCPATTVARHFQRAKATLSEQMAGCRYRASDRALLATPLRRILDECASLAIKASADRREASNKPR
ncbi:MAG: hypothetical protein EOP37_22405 [Rubrivivax sp.]|nr:MAG: hypothetical protein EOP37_22405 [Rubrivivax sp.]